MDTDSGSTTAGESNDPDSPGFDVPPTVWPAPDIAEVPPPSVRGGTMTLSRDGSRMFVGDEWRDTVHIVDVESQAVLGSISQPGCQPGRITEASDQLVFLCTQSGAVVYADAETQEVLSVVEVCANPRGLAVDDSDTAWVACAEGEVLEVRSARVAGRIGVGVELRDIVEVGPPLRVSTFRSPSVLTLDDAGSILEVQEPGLVGVVQERETVPFDDSAEEAPGGTVVGPLVPNVARRVRSPGEGRWQMLHQVARTSAGVTATGWASGNGCVGTQSAALSWVDTDSTEIQTEVLPGLSVAFDAAFDTERNRFAVVGASESGWVVVARGPIDALPTVVQVCSALGEQQLSSMPTAVEFDARGRAWIFAPEDPVLILVDPDNPDDPVVIEFDSEESIVDSGFTEFHLPTPGNVACVACHPEGRDDGLRWELETAHPRRTMSLAGRLDGGAPFHWGGEQEDLASLDASVRVDAMLGFDRGPEHLAAFERYLVTLPAMPPARDQEASAVSAGAQAFVDLGCGDCHLAPRYDNPASVQLPGHGLLQVPSLVGVRYGAPYMHDGRSQTLDVATTDMLEHSQARVEVTQQRRADLRAFLLSL